MYKSVSLTDVDRRHTPQLEKTNITSAGKRIAMREML